VTHRPTQVRRRDGRVVPFDLRRVADAIHQAAEAAGGHDRFLAEELAGVVGVYLGRSHEGRIPDTADVEEAVERVLRDTGHAKAARAFVLHRRRRAAARTRITVEEDAGARPLPVVEGDGSGRVAAWSASRVADALVAEAGLDAAAADEVARAVEVRVLSSGLVRVSSSLVRALVDAELLARGQVRPRERQRVVGLPKHDLERRLEEGTPDRVPRDPQALAEALGEEVLRPWVLEEALPAPVAEAHRLGEIHLDDLGAPFALAVACPSLPAVLARHLRGEGAPRAAGPRRFASALGEAVLRHGGCASRAFVLEDVNVHMAPFVDRLDEDALHLEARELLLSPATLSFPRRGGRLRLEWTLAAELPARLASRPAPAPAPPGRTLGDFADASLRVARALLAAAAEVRREGGADRLPALTLVLPRPVASDPAGRALLREAVALAAAGGEPVLVLDDPGLPSRGSRWGRARAAEAGDPFRFEDGDVSVATVGAVNLVSCALLAGPGGTERFFEEVDRRTGLVLAAAAARRDLVARRARHPDGVLWAAHHEGIALVDAEGARHVVEAVGAGAAAAVLLPGGSAEERRALEEKAVRYLAARAVEEGLSRDLHVALAQGLSPEAAHRLADVDRARFGEDAERVLGPAPDDEPGADRPSGPVREALGPRGARGALALRARLPVAADAPPALDDLVRDVLAAAGDPSVVEIALDPWPRRIVRPSAGFTG
jgi:ribonucleoside-triphosphate reductase